MKQTAICPLSVRMETRALQTDFNRQTHPSCVHSLMKVLRLPVTEKSTVPTISGEINKDHQNQTVLIQTETEGQDFEIESVYWLSDVFSDLHENV